MTEELMSLINGFKDAAIKTMQTHDTVLPIACIPDSNKILGIPFGNQEEKVKVLSTVGAVVAQDKASGVLLVLDSWFSHGKKDEAVVRPTDQPVDDRGQAILISYYDLKGGGADNLTIMVKYTAAKKVVEELTVPKESFADNVFHILMAGYRAMKKMQETDPDFKIGDANGI